MASVASYMQQPKVKTSTGGMGNTGNTGIMGGQAAKQAQQSQMKSPPQSKGSAGANLGAIGGGFAGPRQGQQSQPQPNAKAQGQTLSMGPAYDPRNQRYGDSSGRGLAGPGGINPQAQTMAGPQAGGTGFQLGQRSPLSADQIRQQASAANADWERQNQAWASGQGTPEQQRQALGYFAQQAQRGNPQMRTFGGLSPGTTQANQQGRPVTQGGVTYLPTQGSPAPNRPPGVGQLPPATPSYQPTPYRPTVPGGAPQNEWNPPPFQQTPYNPPAPFQSPVNQYLNNDPNLFNPEAFKDNDAMTPNYLSQMIPLWQMLQNNAQYSQDSQQAASQWGAEFGLQQQGQQFQQNLSTQQQQMAEWMALENANQFAAQFGHTQQMDMAGLGLSQQQITNALNLGLGDQETQQNVANTYAGAQNYGADQQLAGQLGSANTYANAQMYGSDQDLAAAQGYAGAQMYGADQQYAGTQYESDAQKAIAAQQNQFLYAQLQQQAQQAELERQNMMRMTSMQTYGRSQSPQAAWASSWS